MKKLLFTCVLIFVFCFTVKADLNDYSGGTSGAAGNLGSGSWIDSCVGIKVSVISSDNVVKDVEIFLNKNGECSSKFSLDNNPKTHQNSDIKWISGDDVTTYTANFLPGSWLNNKKIINIYNILANDDYKNLKFVIEHKSFASNVGTGDYIVVEPMTVIGGYYGTAFELATAGPLNFNCNKEGSFCWNYQGPVFSGNSGSYSGDNGAMFYKTIYLESDVTDLGLTASYSDSYSERNSCFMSKTCGRGIGVFKYTDVYKTGAIQINKYKQGTSTLITSDSAKFKIYNGTNCTGAVVDIVTTSSGVAISSGLSAGTYSIYEEDSPRGYSSPGNRCVNGSVSVTAGSTTSVSIYNTPTCSARLSAFGDNPAIDQLISLYKEYPNFNNLLDFLNPSCTAKTCDTSSSEGEVALTGCLEATGEASEFNETNLSCYDEQVSTSDGFMGFCKNTIDLNNNLGVNKFYSKAGQFLIRKLDYNVIQIYDKNLNPVTISSNYIANSILKKECYIYGSGNVNGLETLPTVRVYFGDSERELQYDSELLSNGEENVGVFRKYTKTQKYNYKLNDIYVEKITGKVYSEKINDYSEKYEGLVSNLNKDNGNIYFNVIYDGKNANKDNENLCTYITNKEIVKDDKLNVELRFIDTTKPFNRETNTNWCYATSCDKDNQTVKTYIYERNNSYNIQNKQPMYRIVLDATAINAIKEYNKNNKYDNYKVIKTIDDDYINSFLYDLKNGVVNQYDEDGDLETTYGVLNYKLEVVK